MGGESKGSIKKCEREDTCGSLVGESIKIVECDGHQTALKDAGG